LKGLFFVSFSFSKVNTLFFWNNIWYAIAAVAQGVGQVGLRKIMFFGVNLGEEVFLFLYSLTISSLITLLTIGSIGSNRSGFPTGQIEDPKFCTFINVCR